MNGFQESIDNFVKLKLLIYLNIRINNAVKFSAFPQL